MPCANGKCLGASKVDATGQADTVWRGTKGGRQRLTLDNDFGGFADDVAFDAVDEQLVFLARTGRHYARHRRV